MPSLEPITIPMRIASNTEAIPMALSVEIVGGGSGNLQNKTVNPSTTQQVVQADGGYSGLNKVTVTAMPAGALADPTINVSSGGLITAESGIGTAGYIAANATKSKTQQLPTQAAQTIYPSTSDQEIESGKYLTGKQTYKKVVVSGLSADKIVQGTTVKIGDVDDDDRIISVQGTASSGGITPTGTINIVQNGTTDVTNYAAANVAVPNSYTQADEGKVVSSGALVAQTSQSITANGTYNTTLINSMTVNVSGGGGAEGVLTFDFTESLSDIETGLFSFTIDGAGISRDANGLHLSGGVGRAYLNNLSLANHVIEYTIGTVDKKFTGNHGRFIMADSDNGLIYRQTGKWAVYGGSWVDSQQTSPAYVENSTIRIEYPPSGNKVSIYVNDTALFSEVSFGNNALKQIWLGASNAAFYDVTIQSLKIYTNEAYALKLLLGA